MGGFGNSSDHVKKSSRFSSLHKWPTTQETMDSKRELYDVDASQSASSQHNEEEKRNVKSSVLAALRLVVVSTLVFSVLVLLGWLFIYFSRYFGNPSK